MEYIIGALIIIICILLAGFLLRKKYVNRIEKLESWKIDIMNRPVPHELSKVKQLNMTGQTEELFEQWRKEWDGIAACDLPDIEELLIDTEEVVDRYRFKKAGEVLDEIEEILQEIEVKIKKILAEVDELVGSEQKNREEIEKIKEQYRETKKTLFAHRHSYGQAADTIEDQLDKLVEVFLEFEERTKNGNYLNARELVIEIKEKLDTITSKMERIPNVLIECQTGIPLQLNELKTGFQDMLGQGYYLEHLQFEKETSSIERELKNYFSLLEKMEVEEVEEGLEVVKESIELLYDQLEKEVHAKHYIQSQKEETKTLLNEISDNSEKLKIETELVQQTYHVADAELKLQKHLEKQLSQLMNRYQQLELRLSQHELAETILAEDLSEIREMLEALQNEQQEYRETLQTLRKDELQAREKINELKKEIKETMRSIAKSKIPGLPQEYHYLIDDAEESIQIVIDKLNEKPLDIPTVRHFLQSAVTTVEKLAEEAETMMENVLLAEKVIQYGNRYRSRYPNVAEGLDEAELAFRAFDYKSALEQAATTIEKVEPGAFKKIEALLSEEVY